MPGQPRRRQSPHSLYSSSHQSGNKATISSTLPTRTGQDAPPVCLTRWRQEIGPGTTSRARDSFITPQLTISGRWQIRGNQQKAPDNISDKAHRRPGTHAVVNARSARCARHIKPRDSRSLAPCCQSLAYREPQLLQTGMQDQRCLRQAPTPQKSATPTAAISNPVSSLQPVQASPAFRHPAETDDRCTGLVHSANFPDTHRHAR